MLRPATMIALLRHCRLGGLAEPTGVQRRHSCIRPNGPASGTALLLGAALLLGGAPAARANLTLTFSDDGTNSTITASGSLSLADHCTRRSNSATRLVYMRTIWMDNDDSGFMVGRTRSEDKYTYCKYTGGQRTIERSDSYTGKKFVTINGYTANFAIHVENYENGTLLLDPLTGNDYIGNNRTVTFPGTLLSVLGDDDFYMSISIDSSQKVVFKTENPSDRPEAPTALTATPGNTEVTLKWADPDDDTITKYQYQQKLSSATSWGDGWTDITVPDGQTAANMTSYTVTDLINGTEYDFRVRAIGKGGTSDESAEVTATPKIAPAEPIISKVVPGDQSIFVTVGALSDVTAWQSQCKIVNGQFEPWVMATGATDPDNSNNTIVTISNLIVNTRLANNTAYICKVRALNVDVQGMESAETSAVTPHEKPSAPRFEATPGDKRVTLSWSDPQNANIIRYEYQVKKADADYGTTWITIGNPSTIRKITVEELENGIEYTFQIRAITAGHESFTNQGSATPSVAPAKPELILEPGDKKVTLKWTYDETASTAEVDNWQYRAKENGSSVWRDNWSSFADSDKKETREFTIYRFNDGGSLENGTTYDFAVRARTEGGVPGPESNTESARPAAPPAKPTDFKAVPGEKQVTLTWTDPSNDDINEYQYCQKTDDSTCQDSDQDNDWEKMDIAQNVAATTTTYTVTGLTDGTEYTFRIRAVTVGGAGPESDALSVTPRKNSTPTFGKQTIPNQGYEKSFQITELQFPTATGGNDPLTYRLTRVSDSSSPGLPDRLQCAINTEAGGTSCTKITGTPTVVLAKTEYTWTVTDEDGETASLPFTIEVFDKPTVTLELDTNSINENGGVATVTARLNYKSNYDTTVTITATPVDPAEEKDFTLSSPTTLTIRAGATTSTGTVTITAVDNDDHEAAKTVTITAAATYNNQPIPDPDPTTLTIKDDDALTLTLKLDPTEISENGGVATVTASLDKPASSDTTVTIAATPVAPAVAGDVTLSENTKLTIKKDERTSTGTVTITAVDNDVSQKENKTITISAEVATADTDLGLDAPEDVTLTIIEDDTVAMEERREIATKVLAEVARATLAGATSAIDQRFDTALGGPAVLSVADWQVGDTLAANTSLWQQLERWDGDLSTVNRLAGGVDLLTESNFSVALNPARGGTWSIWGRGDWRGFEGTTDIGDYEGSQRAGYLGVDKWLNERLMAGLALSHSTSETDYTIEDEGGRIDTSLTSIWPYLQNTMDNGVQLRLVLGIGKGEVEHYPTGEADEKTDLTMRAVSVAGKLPVAQSGDFTLSATAAASLADMKTEGLASVAAINGLHVSSWNLRAGLEAKHEGFPVSDTQWTLTPRVALALRQDGGDGVTGTGAELSGGLRLAAPDSRFALDASGYWLALHSQDGTKEWGASVEARFSPGEGGEGLSLSVEPAWGVPYQAGVLASEDLFEEERRVNNLGRLSLTAQAGYGFALPSGLLTLFAEFTLPGEAEATRYAAGVNFAAPGGLDAKLSGERQDDDTRVGIDLSVQF